jgi:hypothetical protein
MKRLLLSSVLLLALVSSASARLVHQEPLDCVITAAARACPIPVQNKIGFLLRSGKCTIDHSGASGSWDTTGVVTLQDASGPNVNSVETYTTSTIAGANIIWTAADGTKDVMLWDGAIPGHLRLYATTAPASLKVTAHCTLIYEE